MSKLIPLSKGYSAIVDDDDYEFLMQWKWHAHKTGRSDQIVYAARMSKPRDGKRSRIFMHRELCETPDGHDTDHINGNGLDNRRGNLRIATKSQNQWNRAPNKKCSSRHKGVAWHRASRKWRAEIKVHRRRIYIGLFLSEEEAAAAYAARAATEFGEFNRGTAT